MRTAIVVAIVVACAGAARADDRIEVRGVTFEEANGTTRVHVRATKAPMFSVYKLERPTRIVVDMPRARVADALLGHDTTAAFSPNTWAVSAVTAQQLDDGGPVARLVVTLARPGRYQVESDASDVTIVVTARDPMPVATGGGDSRALDQARADAAKAKQAAAAAQSEAERLRDAAAQAQKVADAARGADAERARGELAKAKADAARAKDAAATGTGRGRAAARDGREGRARCDGRGAAGEGGCAGSTRRSQRGTRRSGCSPR